MARGSKLPRFAADDVQNGERLANKLNELITTLELRIVSIEGPLVDPRDPAVGEEAYVVNNATEKRTLDASTATVADVANVLGTLLEDLHAEEKLR